MTTTHPSRITFRAYGTTLLPMIFRNRRISAFLRLRQLWLVNMYITHIPGQRLALAIFSGAQLLLHRRPVYPQIHMRPIITHPRTTVPTTLPLHVSVYSAEGSLSLTLSLCHHPRPLLQVPFRRHLLTKHTPILWTSLLDVAKKVFGISTMEKISSGCAMKEELFGGHIGWRRDIGQDHDAHNAFDNCVCLEGKFRENFELFEYF